jgi:DNA processing protein
MSAAGVVLSRSQKLNWLRLVRSDNVGPATFRDLINHFGTAAAALEALPDLARRGGAASRIRIASIAEAEAEMDAVETFSARFVALGESDYPAWLRMLDLAPPLICLRGEAEPASRRPVAIVGARNASVAGRKLAAAFAAGLGNAGHAVISGLARGIDTAAHQASMRSGTIAVFAGGIDHLYPPENAELAQAILDNGGAWISEMPFGHVPRALDFPRRNRIIAGLSVATIVVEAAKRSGSLITARLANEAGRHVFAVPGSPLDPRAEGCNHLIRQGATLATDAEQILEAIGPISGAIPQQGYEIGEPPGERGPDDALTYESGAGPDKAVRDRILEALGPTPTDVDDVIRFTGATVAQVQIVLLELDLAGKLERHPGNRVSLTAPVDELATG